MFGQFPQKHQGSPRCVIFHVARVKLLFFETQKLVKAELTRNCFTLLFSLLPHIRFPSLCQVLSRLSLSSSLICPLLSLLCVTYVASEMEKRVWERTTKMFKEQRSRVSACLVGRNGRRGQEWKWERGRENERKRGIISISFFLRVPSLDIDCFFNFVAR